jgi:hypothetical protein
MSSCRAAIKSNEGEPKHAASPLEQAHPRWQTGRELLSGVAGSDRNLSREARCRRAARIKRGKQSTWRNALSDVERGDKFLS